MMDFYEPTDNELNHERGRSREAQERDMWPIVLMILAGAALILVTILIK